MAKFKLTPKAKEFREDLRALLVDYSGGCAIQEGADGSQWPCGTCMCALFTSVMDHEDPQYQQRNDPVDRVNEIWRAVLQIRDAK